MGDLEDGEGCNRISPYRKGSPWREGPASAAFIVFCALLTTSAVATCFDYRSTSRKRGADSCDTELC